MAQPLNRRTLLRRMGIFSIGGGALIAGCGGGGGKREGTSDGFPVRTRGAVTFTIHWPAPSRLIPQATQSIRLTAKVLVPDSGEVVGEKLIPRPQGAATSTVTMESLPSVRCRIIAQAFATPDGTGKPLAEGSVEVAVPENGTAEAALTLNAVESNNVMLTTQAQVNAFGGTTSVLGTLDIVGSDIVTLEPLRSLRSIGGFLRVRDTRLNSLAGLENLGSCAEIFIVDNPQLGSLDGITPPIQRVSRVQIARNNRLSILKGLEFLAGSEGLDLEIISNPLLTSIHPLAGLTRAKQVIIAFNDLLTNVDALRTLTAVENGLIVSGRGLLNVDGLAAVQTAGSVVVQEGDFGALGDFSLPALTRAGDIDVRGSDSVGSVQSVSFPALTHAGEVECVNLSSVTSVALPALTTITTIRGEGVSISNNKSLLSVTLTSLSGSDAPDAEQGRFSGIDITGNQALQRVTLGAIRVRTFAIVRNPALGSVGTGNMNIENQLRISDNDVFSLGGLGSGRAGSIQINRNKAFTDEAAHKFADQLEVPLDLRAIFGNG